MDFELTPEIQELVNTRVRDGGYASPSDVVTEAVRLLDQRERLLQLQKATIHAQICQGLESLAQGKGISDDEVFRQIDEEIAAAAREESGC